MMIDTPRYITSEGRLIGSFIYDFWINLDALSKRDEIRWLATKKRREADSEKRLATEKGDGLRM